MNSPFPQNTQTWEWDIPCKPLKIAVVREEFVSLTKDPLIAIVLNQMVYWSQRVKDFDLFLEEEKILNHDSTVQLRYGWIYKTAEELIEETMLRVSHPTMRKYLKLLVDQGWLEERLNSKDKWDKTTQYRVNLRKLQKDLFDLGYCLPGFSLPPKEEAFTPSKPADSPNVRILQSDVRNLHSNVKNFDSNVKNLHSYTYTETTSENTNREHTQRARDSHSMNVSEFDDQSMTVSEKMIGIWKTHVVQSVLQATEERKKQLTFLLNSFFQNDITQWESFCERVKSSPFLMGEGARKWHITLDWILIEGNLLKVLEGNFDDPDTLEKKNAEDFKTTREHKVQEILESIEDPVWKYWCSQLISSSNDPLKGSSLSTFELEAITKAKFLETEDNRLVWIGSSDQDVLNHIENLRLELLSIVQRTFPNARNIRTRLQELEISNQEKAEPLPSPRRNESSDSRSLTPLNPINTTIEGENNDK